MSSVIEVGGLKFKKEDLRKNPLVATLTAILLALKELNNKKVNDVLRKFEIIIRDSQGKIYRF